ncbi:hypothetical protein N9W41_01645, partial [bacterium]|nr:hypothetical protein [bacterium]
RLRYTNTNNENLTTVDDASHMFNQRLKLDGTYRAGEKFSLTYTLLHNTEWGQGGMDGTFDDTLGGTFTASSANSLMVNNAYANWMASDDMSFRAGRFSIQLAGGEVLSVQDWVATPYAFEGLGMFYNTSFAHIALFGASMADLGATTTVDPERNAYILSADFKSLPDFMKTANVHVVQINANESTSSNAESKMNVGLVVGGDVAGVSYNLAFESQGGTDGADDLSGTMTDLALGYAFGSVKASFGYHTDSGDDAATATNNEAYNPMYYDAHRYAGLGDFAQTNWGERNPLGEGLTYMNVGADWNGDDMGVGFHYYTFTKTVSGDAIGSEMDLVFNKKYSDNFNIGAFVAMFTPDDAVGTETAQKAVITSTWNF